MFSIKSEVCGTEMWKPTVMCRLSQQQEWAPLSVTREAVLTAIWLIGFSAAQEWLSVIWLTIRHGRASELFANELMGSSGGASSLLHLLVFPETFSVQRGCRCKVWDTSFYLVYLSRKEHVTKENVNSMRENVSEFVGNDLKGLLSETPAGDQPVLTACDNFSKHEIKQPHKHKPPPDS